MNDENGKLQSSFVYIILVLLLFCYAGFIFVACRSYVPFNFYHGLNTEADQALWSLMRLPAIILPIALWLANLLNRRLNSFTLLSVLLTSCFIVVIPRLYDLGTAYDISFFAPSFSFFLISCSISALIKDLRRDKRMNRIANIIISILLILIFMGMIFMIAYVLWLFKESYFYGITLCMLIPFACGIAVLESFLDVYSKGTFILKLVAVGYGCLCAGIIDMCGTARWVILFVLISTLALIWQLIDLGKFIIVRRNKNDSESCNA